MASIHKDPRGKSPFWYCSFRLPNGKRTLRSTKETDRRRAQVICYKWEEAGKRAEQGRLTESASRKVIAEIFEMANGDALPSATVGSFFESWLASKKVETSGATFRKYEDVSSQFLAYLGDRKAFEMPRIGKAEISGFRDSIGKRGLTPGTANLALKIIRSAFTQAQRDGIVTENPAKLVKSVGKGAESDRRRAFTLPELERILEHADEEWRGLVMFGLYTGQRLGDLAGLTWENIDLARAELILTTGKTGRRQILPLARPLLRFVESLPTGDDPKQPLFPKAFDIVESTGRVGTLSNQFHDLLCSAGLAKPRTHKSRGKGRSTKRETSTVSFHSLRHTATSLLKNAGISPAIVQEFVGHDSKTVSEHYTHIETESLRKAANALPDVLA